MQDECHNYIRRNENIGQFCCRHLPNLREKAFFYANNLASLSPLEVPANVASKTNWTLYVT